VEKQGTMEILGFQGVPITLGPSRASEPKRYLDSLPDILTTEEVAGLGLGNRIESSLQSEILPHVRHWEVGQLRLGCPEI
jgi:hypothetical protein